MTLIDQLFTQRYSILLDYTNKAVKHFRRKYKPEVVISESYIYASNKIYKLDITIDEIEGDVKKFIKNTIMWDRSTLNRNKNFNDVNKSFDLEYVNLEYDVFNVIYNGEVIEDMISEYVETLTRIEKRLFNMYYTKGLTTTREIKKHLNMTSNASHQTYKECIRVYNGLREFVLNKIK